MRILEMTGCFGKLAGETLALSPGVNCIYAPNEAGKSTWSQFLRVMLYGLNTRDRGAAADKNRYLPWDGTRMQGRLLLEPEDGRRCVLRRSTLRAGAPMGDFSCTYEGTATPVEGIGSQNAGQALLGITREVFERSAFIRQSALAVEQDAELERRIAALITSGEEDVSFSESYERLKKQLNRRRYNRSGLLPQLETEIAGLQAQLQQLESLYLQSAQAEAQLADCQARLQAVQAQQALWKQLERQSLQRRWRDAREEARSAEARAAQRKADFGAIPDAAALSAMEAQLVAAQQVQRQLALSQERLQQARTEAQAAEEACRAHRLYPADEAALRSRMASLQAPPAVSKLLWLLPVTLLLASGVCAYITGMISTALYPWTVAAAAATVISSLGLWFFSQKRAAQRAQILRRQEELRVQTELYLPLLRRAEETDSSRVQSSAEADSLSRQLPAITVTLGALLQPYCPGAETLADMETSLQLLRQHRLELDAAVQEAEASRLRLSLLQESLPEEPLFDADEALPVPEMSREEVEDCLAELTTRQRDARSQLDTLSGQRRACGEKADLEAQLTEKQRRRQALTDEYDALSLAMEVLSQANTQLQNRFSPALGARAAEIFRAITGGRYEKVLLSRSFALEAEPTGDCAGRSVQLLSQGTADQLYLAVRLAICEMVLPAEHAVPLVLDDALLSFDDGRLHSALDYLLQAGQQRQILLFTCQHREESYLTGRSDVHFIHLN